MSQSSFSREKWHDAYVHGDSAERALDSPQDYAVTADVATANPIAGLGASTAASSDFSDGDDSIDQSTSGSMRRPIGPLSQDRSPHETARPVRGAPSSYALGVAARTPPNPSDGNLGQTVPPRPHKSRPSTSPGRRASSVKRKTRPEEQGEQRHLRPDKRPRKPLPPGERILFDDTSDQDNIEQLRQLARSEEGAKRAMTQLRRQAQSENAPKHTREIPTGPIDEPGPIQESWKKIDARLVAIDARLKGQGKDESSQNTSDDEL